MWSWLNPVIHGLLPLVYVAAAGWIAQHITKPTDLDRAKLLSIIANAVAAYVLSLNPGAVWADLLRDVIQGISSAAGLPTRNAQAIERAAIAALIAHGKAPDASR